MPTWETSKRFKHDVFTFVRIRYASYGGRGGWGGEVGAPVSWPLVERRRVEQLIPLAEDRRKGEAARQPAPRVDAAPLTPFRIAAFVGGMLLAGAAVGA